MGVRFAMPREAHLVPLRCSGLLAAIPGNWRAGLASIAAAWLMLGVLFRADWIAMAGQWWNSSTYNHILLIPFVLAWLVWQRAAELAKLQPRPWWPGLLLFAAAAWVWMLGAFAGLTIAMQLGTVAMLAMSVLVILGPRVGAGLAFPLGYMFLLVPFGDELVPPLQMLTAALTVGLVRLSNVPAVIDGVFIDTPAGLFEVAEACSGVKFLIAMFAFGVLAANVCFVSWRKRAVFMAVCLAVPIAANGIRAWATIFAAQFVGARAAAGFDHVVYGWVFFALVIALVIGLSWRHFDRAVDDPGIDGARINGSALLGRLEVMAIGPLRALLILTALALGAQGWARAAEVMTAPLPRQLFLPEVPGWRRVAYAPRAWWEPRANGAEHRLLGRYANGNGQEVDVFVALYSSQGEGREAGGFGEGALPPGQGWSWMSPGPEASPAKVDRLLAEGRVVRLAETYYRTGGLLTGSNVRLKLANIEDRLLLRSRPTTLLILSAEELDDRSAKEAIGAFRRSTGPLDAWMDRIVAVR